MTKHTFNFNTDRNPRIHSSNVIFFSTFTCDSSSLCKESKDGIKGRTVFDKHSQRGHKNSCFSTSKGAG